MLKVLTASVLIFIACSFLSVLTYTGMNGQELIQTEYYHNPPLKLRIAYALTATSFFETLGTLVVFILTF